MNVVEKAGANLRPNTVDFERFRLRRFIESLGAEELDTCDAAIDLAGLAEVMEGNAESGAVPLGRPGAGRTCRQCHGRPRPDRARRSASSRTSS